MTPDERQELRKKHSKIHVCGFGNFPCDVIKVLDAWEEANNVEENYEN